MVGVVTINADTSAIRVFSNKLRRAYPEIAKDLRRQVKVAGDLIAADAKARTTSDQARRTIRASATGDTATVRAGSPRSPLPVLLEGDGSGGTWRAPNFPPAGARGTDAFVRGGHDQDRHPYLHPALRAQEKPATAIVTAAVLGAIDRVVGN